jgi:hypothetical protein
MLRITAELRQHGDLVMLFVTPQPNSAAIHLKQTIRKYRLDCPVLFYGDGPKVANKEWDIHGNPIGFLIDPQGTIIAKGVGLQTHELAELAEWIHEHGGIAPRVGLRTAVHPATDGSIDLALELSSPGRVPLQVQLDYKLVQLEYDAAGTLIKVTRTKPVEQGPEQELTVDCGDWGEVVHHLSIDLTGYQGIEYEVRVLLPGTDSARDGKGFWARQAGWYFYNGANVNGEKN